MCLCIFLRHTRTPPGSELTWERETRLCRRNTHSKCAFVAYNKQQKTKKTKHYLDSDYTRWPPTKMHLQQPTWAVQSLSVLYYIIRCLFMCHPTCLFMKLLASFVASTSKI